MPITQAECSRYRIVAGLVTSSSPIPLKTRREREVPAQVSSSSLEHGSKLRGPSVVKSPRVAEQCDVNIHSLTPTKDLQLQKPIGYGHDVGDV
ncbi:hypothetical protein TNCV_2343831 [Trichonephila clavipes]|nr:hypothetical protein TNCV_2343831 [Trichonephila clavipes]